MNLEGGRSVTGYVGMSMRETDDGHIVGVIPRVEHVRDASGAFRAGALLTILDSAGGLCSGLAALPDGWVVTTNMTARTVRLDHVGPLRVEAHVLRTGKNNVVAAATIYDDGNHGALITDGVVTSSILVPENGPPQWQRPVVLETRDDTDDEPLPFATWLQARPVDDRTVELDLADELRNPWGILHGGVVASLVDEAAAHATGGVTTDVVLHFLAPNREGPVRATATPMGPVTRVEVVDAGADRVTAVAIATTMAV